MMNATTHAPIANLYVTKESHLSVKSFLANLKQDGLHLKGITVDGHKAVMAFLRSTWPDIILQRCLAHIQRQGLMWIRTYPKTQAGRELKILLNQITLIHTFKDRNRFIERFHHWQKCHQYFVNNLPQLSVAFTDLKRTVALLTHAWPDLFHFLETPALRPTTNALEGFFSRVKADFRRHRGLSKEHKISYLRWYCYFKKR